MSGRLLGKTCLVAGGTSGIGLASARRFLREGARVVVAGLDDATTASATASLEPYGEVRAITADLRFEDQVVRLFDESQDFLRGRIDILLHAAGISGRKYGDGPLHECTADGWNEVFRANAFSMFLTNRQAVRALLLQPPDEAGLRGTIVNVGSVLSESPSPHAFGTIAYAASKGAARSLTLGTAARYAPDRIRFHLIEPGLIATPMAARASGDAQILAFLATKQPMSNGPGTAEDVAEVALFLCEPASRFTTGAILAVDGGWRVSEGQIPGSLT